MWNSGVATARIRGVRSSAEERAQFVYGAEHRAIRRGRLDAFERYPAHVCDFLGTLEAARVCDERKAHVEMLVCGLVFTRRDGVNVHVEQRARFQNWLELPESDFFGDFAARGRVEIEIARVDVTAWLYPNAELAMVDQDQLPPIRTQHERARSKVSRLEVRARVSARGERELEHASQEALLARVDGKVAAQLLAQSGQAHPGAVHRLEAERIPKFTAKTRVESVARERASGARPSQRLPVDQRWVLWEIRRSFSAFSP
jgi:hypothetical protein